MDHRIERCYRKINPFTLFPAGHGAVKLATANKYIGALAVLVLHPPFGSRYPTGRRRVAGKPTVYEIKMLLYLEALRVDPKASPPHAPTKDDRFMLDARDGSRRWECNPFEKYIGFMTESDDGLKTESDSSLE